MSTELVAITPKHLAVSDEQTTLARQTVARELNNHEFALFLYNCQRQGIHPLDNLLIPVVRTDNGVRKLTFTTTVDLLRSRAAETDEYAGSDDVKFEEDSKGPYSATVTVWRMVKGVRCPFTATALWDEYCPGGKQDFMWKGKPHVMLGKCAEALALRKAFPKQLAGMYAAEEVQRYDEGPKKAKQVIQATLPANVETMTVSQQPNRGHADTGLQRTEPKQDPVMCAECRVVDGHKPDCSILLAKQEQDRKTSKPTIMSSVMILEVAQKTTTKGPKKPFLVLKCVDDANNEGTLFVWHKSFFEYLVTAKDKRIICELTSEVKGDKTYHSVEHILELGGVKFVNDKPAAQAEMPAQAPESDSYPEDF